MSDAAGHYRAEVNTGVYYVYTFGSGGGRAYIDEIFPDILCPGDCDFRTALQSGGRLVVTANGTVRADFALYAGGAIAGTITDAVTSAPLAGIHVAASSLIGGVPTSFGGAMTDASGHYLIEGLPPGRYYANTLADTLSGYLNEIFDDIDCGRACARRGDDRGQVG